MRWFRFSALVLTVTILQATVVDVFAVGDIKPDLLLILLVFFAVYGRSRDAMIASFVIGFAADLIGPAMGPHVLSFGLLGTLVAYVNRIIMMRQMAHQAVTIFVVGLLAGTLIHYLTLLKTPSAAGNVIVSVVGGSLYSAIVGPFFFLPCTALMGIRTDKIGRC